MRKQQKVWEAEHAGAGNWPSLDSETPASGVVEFVKWLASHGVKPPARALDIGCGKGRNSIYLAKLGFETTGVDYVSAALEIARKRAEKNGVSKLAQFQVAEMDAGWPFPSGFFDIAVDNFSSIDIETAKGREKCRDELLRTLSPGGYAMAMVVSAADELESELIKSSPGPERNSVIWPQNGKFQKNYDESELREFYSDFEIVELRKIRKKAVKVGREYEATNYWLVLRKHA